MQKILKHNYLPRGGTGAHAAVAEAIGKRIVGGVYPVGSILPNEAAWSDEFGLSRSVIREAVKMLAAKGLLTSRPRIGSRVAPRVQWNLLDHDVLAWYSEVPGHTQFLTTLQEFRHIFEPEAAALAARKRTDAQMAKITEACEGMANAKNLGERSLADVAFHNAILDAAGNELLLPLGSLIESTLDRLFFMINRVAGQLRHAQQLHEAIEQAIRQQDPEAARQAVRALLANSDEYIAKVQTMSLTEEPTLPT